MGKLIKKFEDFTINEGIFDRFKKNKSVEEIQVQTETPSDEIEDTSVETPLTNGILLMDVKPYDKSDFGQLKYGIYLTDYSKNDYEYYYLGDLREFTKASVPNRYISYLQLDKIHIEEPHGILHSVDGEAETIIQKELDRVHHSRSIMDDMITYREEIENKFGIKIHNPIF